VLLFTLVTVLIAGVLFGCAPAWQVARSSIHEVLKLGGRSGISGHRHRLGRGLVVAEFALALTLLAVAGLVMRSYWSRTHMDMGVNIEKVLTFQLPLRQDSLTSQESLDQQIRVLMEKIGAVPGVLNTSVVSGVPLTSPRFTRGAPVTPSNKPPADPSRPPQVRFRMVSPGFFQTFDVQTIQGRVLSDQDRRGSMPVAMVNETFARAEFGSQGAVGQEITFWESKRPRKAQVVGVYHDIPNSEEFGDATQPEVIVPIAQSQIPNTWIAVRTTGQPEQVRQSIAAAIRSLNPVLPMAYVRTMEQVLEERTAFERFETILYGSFAGIALLLAAVGIYGLMTFIVAQRVPEMGLRMALGADRPTLLRSVLNDGLKLALMGLLLGAGGAYYAAEVLESSLHGVGGVDVTAFATVAVVLLLAAMLACFLPASRAAGVDPMKSLRSE
jgi:putative ABC transport system permease protein